MRKLTLCAPFLALSLAACGGNHSSSGKTQQTTAPPVTTTRAIDAHGELIDVGGALAFLEDGAPEAYEVANPTVLTAAGLHAGFAVQVSGDVDPNLGGSSALSEALRVASFEVDDVVTTGRLRSLGGGIFLHDQQGVDLIPIGPLAASLIQQTQGRPLRVTGRIDPAYPVGVGVIITSWRTCETLGVNHTMPLLGFDRFEVLDLRESGAYDAESVMAIGPGLRRSLGSGRSLSSSTLGDLQGLTLAANLRSQPTLFQPAQIYPDHPVTTLSFSDALGDVQITIYSGAILPSELDALLRRLQGLPATLPMIENLERGNQSLVSAAGAAVARDRAAWDVLWRSHSSASQPTVDFTTRIVVGVFDGQRPTGGYAIELTSLERIGPNLHFGVTRTSPSGGAPSVLTYPFHLVRVNAPAGAEVFVDGQRVP